MKAIVINGYGGPDALNLVDVAKPILTAGKILVRVVATAVDPGNVKRAAGLMRGHAADLEFPWIPGMAISGVVEEIGNGVSEFNVGDQVYGFSAGGGGLGEFVVLEPRQVAELPRELTHLQAASIAVSGQTALQALDAADLKAGQRLLILGAGGAVGSIAVQLAKSSGAHVIAACRKRSADRLLSLGADEVIDSEEVALALAVKDVDVVIDAVGGDYLKGAYGVVNRDGLLLSLTEVPSEALANKFGIRATMVRTQSQGSNLNRLSRAFEEGRIVPFVGRTYSLADAALAWKDYSARVTDGKIVIAVMQA